MNKLNIFTPNLVNRHYLNNDSIRQVGSEYVNNRFERTPVSDVFETKLDSILKSAEKQADKYDDIPETDMFGIDLERNEYDDIVIRNEDDYEADRKRREDEQMQDEAFMYGVILPGFAFEDELYNNVDDYNPDNYISDDYGVDDYGYDDIF